MIERMKGAEEVWALEDIKDEIGDIEPELYSYILRLPEQLRSRHFTALQKLAADFAHEGAGAVRARRMQYILDTLDSRERAIEEFESVHPVLQAWRDANEGALRDVLRDTLVADDNRLGAGTTARVKSLHIPQMDDSIAVKYLLTPNPKTLSASGEYAMLKEVKTVTEIESVEQRLGVGERIAVPHPLFFYKHGELQCYGMTEIKGITLEQLVDDAKQSPVLLKEKIVASLKDKYREPEAIQALLGEVQIFMGAVHEVCLHGDIKLGNMMVDEEGKLYLIDFGQSLHMMNESEDTSDQFTERKKGEQDQMRECVRSVLNYIRGIPQLAKAA